MTKEYVEKCTQFMREKGFSLHSDVRRDEEVISLNFWAIEDIRLGLSHRFVTIFEEEQFEIYTCVNPGMIKITTGKVGSLFYPKQFDQFDRWLKEVEKTVMLYRNKED